MKIKLTKKNYLLVIVIINVFVKKKTIFMERLDNNESIAKPFIGGKCFVHSLFKKNKKGETPILGFFSKTSTRSFPLYENAEIQVTNKQLVLKTKTPISEETNTFFHENYSKEEGQAAIVQSLINNFSNHLYSLDYFSELYDSYVYCEARDLLVELIVGLQTEFKKSPYAKKIIYTIIKQHPTLNNKSCKCMVNIDVKKFKKTGSLFETFILTIIDDSSEGSSTKTFHDIILFIQDLLVFLEYIGDDEDETDDTEDYNDYDYSQEDDFFYEDE